MYDFYNCNCDDFKVDIQVETNITPVYTLGDSSPIYFTNKGRVRATTEITFSNGIKIIGEKNFWRVIQPSIMYNEACGQYYEDFEDILSILPESIQMIIIFNLDYFRRL